MSKRIVIAIDVWAHITPSLIDRMVHKINSLDNIEAVLFATYAKQGSKQTKLTVRDDVEYQYHPTMREQLNVYSEELIPDTYPHSRYRVNNLTNNAKRDILLLEKSFDFDDIIMMGGAWRICLHTRSYGINNLKKVLPHKNIVIYPECISYERPCGW